MAPPKERAKTSTAEDISTTADNDKKATWNSATAKLPAFITALRRNDSMLGLVHHSYSLVRRGWFADSKGKKMVESYRHMVWIIDNPDIIDSFQHHGYGDVTGDVQADFIAEGNPALDAYPHFS